MGKKSLATKKRPRSSSGSSSTLRPPPSLTDEHRHRFRDMLRTKVFKTNVLYNSVLMREYGLESDFQRYFADPAWARLFSIEEKTYKAITFEVLSSFEIAYPYPVNGLRNEVSFSAFGQYYHIPMAQFCVYSGLYTEEEVQSDDFQNLPNTWNQQDDMNNFWKTISTRWPYDSSASRGTQLRANSARLLHWMLVRSLNGRIHSTSVVSQPDLFAMFSMMTSTRINVAIQLAFAIRHQTQNSIHGVFCGAFITRILKNMEIFPSEEPEDIASVSYMMAETILLQWHFPKAANLPDDSVPPPAVNEPIQPLSAHQLTEEIQHLKKQQTKILKRQKKLKTLIVSCFKSIADTLKSSLPACVYSSSSEDNDDRVPHSNPTAPTTSGLAAGDDVDDIDREIDTYVAEDAGDTEILEHGSDNDDAGTTSVPHMDPTFASGSGRSDD